MKWRVLRIMVMAAACWQVADVLAKSRSAEEHYQSFCASCHGPDMSGGLGPPLNDAQWKHGAADADLVRVIKEGVPKAGMPAWSRSLSDADIRSLVILIRERATSPKMRSAGAAGRTHEAAGHRFALQQIGDAPGELWSMDFLPDGTVIATQKDGQLWLYKNGERLGPVRGTPKVSTAGQGGLLEVQRHPDGNSGWIYLTLADRGGNGAMTKVVRGKLNGLNWVSEQPIFVAAPEFYSDADVHFGSRLIFQGGFVFFSIGDRGQQKLAQDLSFPYGKIHRLRDDGQIPQDNPFITTPKAIGSIWSYGHRNAQGMAVHPSTGDLWAAEHGPRGGDEINRIVKGANFGWPEVTYGMNYDGTPITAQTQREGMASPRHYWVPSIAVAEIDFYTGDQFPKWRNHLLVGSLAKQQLRLIRIEQEALADDTLLFEGLGRIRDVADGPDGFPYVILNGASGAIYRLVPAP